MYLVTDLDHDDLGGLITLSTVNLTPLDESMTLPAPERGHKFRSRGHEPPYSDILILLQ